MERKLATVVSHPRSGTHFLMNTLAEHFAYIASPWFDFDGWGNMFSPKTMINSYSDLLENPQVRRNIIKSHYEVHFYLNVFDDLFVASDFIYIYRNTDAVLRSYRIHLLKRDERILVPRYVNQVEFNDSPPFGELLRYQAYQYKSMRERVERHKHDWLTRPTAEQRDRIIYIKYEDLNDHFEDTVKYLARRLGYPVPDVIKRPSKEDWHVE